MAVNKWTDGAADGNWGTAGNWSDGVPNAADDVKILTSSRAITSGMDQSAVNLDSLTIGEGFTGTIGTSASPLKLGTVGEMVYYAPDCKSCNLWPVAITKGYVLGMHPTPGSLYLVNGTATMLQVVSGQGTKIGASATATMLRVMPAAGRNVNVTVDAGATLTAVEQTGGTIVSAAALVTGTIYGGLYRHEGDLTAVTTLNQSGGTFKLSSGGTVTAANMRGGLLDMREDSRGATITTLTTWPGCKVRANASGTDTATTWDEYGGDAVIGSGTHNEYSSDPFKG